MPLPVIREAEIIQREKKVTSSNMVSRKIIFLLWGKRNR